MAVRGIPGNSNPRCRGPSEVMGAAVSAMGDAELPMNVEIDPRLEHLLVSMAVNHNAVVRVFGREPECAPSRQGPCRGYVEQAFTSGFPKEIREEKSAGRDIVQFELRSDQRMLSDARRMMMNHRSAVCFYPDASMPYGWLVGYVELHADRADVQAFIVFVCFFTVALPLVCTVTAMLHFNKQERCRQQVQELRIQIQRRQLEQELQSLRAPTRSDAADESSGAPGASMSGYVPPG
eukprot:gnl/TRDRNA2_/TRDRNA2_167541_c0_seq2.p1 gnl/TRDRNA2_/TRDRNA2_167541_c0~~gnl/TRDRNA2_/TRDRNA2_167541_c0_seq2.p1  ORF type:complete len:271 (+),score=35.59 gnl/TRDRNA2_/TRDRNA2_167541_c0_seq2:107-814(+)